MERRKFLQTISLGSLGFAASLSVPIRAWSFFQKTTSLSTAKQRLSWLAYRSASFEGPATITEIEGSIPASIRGTLYRIGPGSKETFGRELTHFFDGDAYLSALHISDSRVQLQSAFVGTPERAAEQAAKKMLYTEFGTACEGHSRGYKYPPNINIQTIGGKLLALSESSWPTALDPESLHATGTWNFGGSLAVHTTFTAHPKLDPVTGDVYSYGITQALSPELKVFRLAKGSEQLTQVASHSLGGFFPIHDCLLTENYMVFLVAPLKVKLLGAALGQSPIADLLEYDGSKPFRIILVRKDGSASPLEIESSPGGLAFHHCNAWEESGQLHFDSVVMPDDSAYAMFENWSADVMPPSPNSWITRFSIDLATMKLRSRTQISDGVPTDFPGVNSHLLGKPMSHYHLLEAAFGNEDPLAFNTLACWDLEARSAKRITVSARQCLGEPLYVPDDKNAWILHLGYDADRDETFLDIRKEISLELVARAWLGRYLPLGFHGSFIPRA